MRNLGKLYIYVVMDSGYGDPKAVVLASSCRRNIIDARYEIIIYICFPVSLEDVSALCSLDNALYSAACSVRVRAAADVCPLYLCGPSWIKAFESEETGETGRRDVNVRSVLNYHRLDSPHHTPWTTRHTHFSPPTLRLIKSLRTESLTPP